LRCFFKIILSEAALPIGGKLVTGTKDLLRCFFQIKTLLVVVVVVVCQKNFSDRRRTGGQTTCGSGGAHPNSPTILKT
jgi:hypothetical protein